jgi:hypothetical protein
MTVIKPEPERMTMMDVISFVVGVAATFATFTGAMKDYLQYPYYEPNFFNSRATEFIGGLGLVISVVVFARLYLYRRMPHPAEWEAILISLFYLKYCCIWINDLIALTSTLLPQFVTQSLTQLGLRWLIAGLFSIIILASLIMLRLTRRLLPPWQKSLILTGLALLAFIGPLTTVKFFGAYLISKYTPLEENAFLYYYCQFCRRLAGLPIGIMFGIPAIALLMERVRRCRWKWTEWAAFSVWSVSCLPGLVLVPEQLSRRPSLWLIEGTFNFGWLLAVVWLSWLIVVRLGPAWLLWIGEPKIQDLSSVSKASESSISF